MRSQRRADIEKLEEYLFENAPRNSEEDIFGINFLKECKKKREGMNTNANSMQNSQIKRSPLHSLTSSPRRDLGAKEAQEGQGEKKEVFLMDPSKKLTKEEMYKN